MKNLLLSIVLIWLPFMVNGQISLELNYIFNNSVYPNGFVPDSSGNGYDADITDFSLEGVGYQAYVEDTLKFASHELPIRAIQMDSIIIKAKSYVGISGTNPRTIMAWIKTDTLVDADRIIVTYGETKSNRFEFAVGVDACMRFNDKDQEYRSEHKIKHLEWFHVATTYDGTTLKFFIDGVETDAHEIALNTGSTEPVTVGGFGTGKKLFYGLMYDFRMYNNIMNETEITDVINETMQIETSVKIPLDNLSDNLILYPNPSKNTLHIRGINHLENFDIFDITGRKLISGRLDISREINVESLREGVYFLKLSGYQKAIKFIKE